MGPVKPPLVPPHRGVGDLCYSRGAFLRSDGGSATEGVAPWMIPKGTSGRFRSRDLGAGNQTEVIVTVVLLQ